MQDSYLYPDKDTKNNERPLSARKEKQFFWAWTIFIAIIFIVIGMGIASGNCSFPSYY